MEAAWQLGENVTDDIQTDTGSAQQVNADDEVGFRGEYGYQTDPQTGLVLAGHRYYSPFTRRWMNRDPIGYDGGTNLYEYSGDDPVNEIDPSGNGGFWSGFWAGLRKGLFGTVHLNQPSFNDAADNTAGFDSTEIAASDPPLNQHPAAASAGFRHDATVAAVGIVGSVALGALGEGAGGAGGAADAGAAEGAGGGQTIALGVREWLDQFAQEVNGKTWKSWGTRNFPAQFASVMSDARNDIHFNLAGPKGEQINAMSAAQEGARGFGKARMTSYELAQIYQHSEWWPRITFYYQGNIVANPFAR
jgi:RHS repeat-associated protein